LKIKKPKNPKTLTFQVFKFFIKSLGFLKWVWTARIITQRCRLCFLFLLTEYEAATAVPKQTLVPLLTSKLADPHFIGKTK